MVKKRLRGYNPIRTFGGEIYEYAGCYDKKTTARTKAENIRDIGNYARVIRGRKGYLLYVRLE
jgi:hypothetical protein